jgi:very-short-patch-repair endonuclease
MKDTCFCIECRRNIYPNEFQYSLEKFGVPLCREHQDWIQFMSTQTTFETIRLYFALKLRGVPAAMEKFDGFKHIDIAIPEAKINIEVDGGHHNYNDKQALADLKRTYFSFLKGYYTIRIPNSLVYNEYILNETADFIVGILNESLNKHYGLR